MFPLSPADLIAPLGLSLCLYSRDIIPSQDKSRLVLFFFFLIFEERWVKIRTEKDKASQNDFSQQVEGIFKIKAFIVTVERKELTGWWPDLCLRNIWHLGLLARAELLRHLYLLQSRPDLGAFPKCNFQVRSSASPLHSNLLGTWYPEVHLHPNSIRGS